MKHSKKKNANALYYGAAITLAFAIGATPALLNFSVDPYELFRKTDRTNRIQEVAEKAHYPLWKLGKYEKGKFDTIILGDSRARALRDKYWHELGLDKTLNAAYGGGTIPEIYSTFQHLKNDSAIKNLVVGIQLRSFDEKHKGGMDRVPEAITLVENRLEYLKNWSIFKTAWHLLTEEEKKTFQNFEAFAKVFSLEAHADEQFNYNSQQSVLIESQLCHNCDIVTELERLSYKFQSRSQKNQVRYSDNSGGQVFGKYSKSAWNKAASLYQLETGSEPLPPKMARQVTKNAKSDWSEFEFSELYWSYLEEISDWAKENDKNLIFVIPPTIEDMQQTIKIYGLDVLNHRMRVELAKLAPVVDFDFSNELTKNIGNFSDAYHFNSKISKQIVSQLSTFLTREAEIINRAKKRSGNIDCAVSDFAEKSQNIETPIRFLDTKNCRLWRQG